MTFESQLPKKYLKVFYYENFVTKLDELKNQIWDKNLMIEDEIEK